MLWLEEYYFKPYMDDNDIYEDDKNVVQFYIYKQAWWAKYITIIKPEESYAVDIHLPKGAMAKLEN
jgi:hypothetical protein